MLNEMDVLVVKCFSLEKGLYGTIYAERDHDNQDCILTRPFISDMAVVQTRSCRTFTSVGPAVRR